MAASAIYLRESCTPGERAASFRFRTDVRQEPSQADGIAGVTGLAKPISTGRSRLPCGRLQRGGPVGRSRLCAGPLRPPLLFGANLAPEPNDEVFMRNSKR